MDVKSLAISKRAHSQNHSKKHQPHFSSKSPSVASDDKKPTGKLAKGKTPHSHIAKPLPSNWERYGEDLDLDSDEALTSSGQPAEFVVPKSKGADYAHLMSEANDQSRSNRSRDVSQLFDDVITDFARDFGPMLLAAKGQSLLSWAGDDDDLEMEENAGMSIEAPFLSLNLNVLAEQLAKAKLSERCFLEPDLFPWELLDELQACDQEDRPDTQTRTSAAESSSRFSSRGLDQEFSNNTYAQQDHESSSSTITVQTPARALEAVKQENTELVQSSESIPERFSASIVKSPLAFQAASAEAELDILLSSFGETHIVESATDPPTSVVSGGKGKDGGHAVKSDNIDDDIDKLLEEMSNLMVSFGEGSNEVRAAPGALSSDSKSKLLDDFDSWLDTI